ncbi:hypothetical protein FQN54_005865 [Arachnomyces sp. PD_36]|nr:hypothetical protein FQN54_005865 [Arachnomyces sp. PD_36]
MLKLFSVLSAWQSTGRLVLELNVYSPSDEEHWLKSLHPGLEHEFTGDLVQRQEANPRWHDPKHGWVDGRRFKSPPAAEIARLFQPNCSSRHLNLPEVRAVTELVIRRQLRRQIFSETLQLVWQKLPRLESIVYETLRVWNSLYEPAGDGGLTSAIKNTLPSNVKRISIFEDFDGHIPTPIRRGVGLSALRNARLEAELALRRALASKSRDLEQLSISYLIDATRLFGCSQQSWTWYHLQSLTLTASILKQTAPPKDIYALLYNARSCAINMLQLESMVLWNHGHKEACAFIYHRDKAGGQATLTWRGTWDFELSHDVIEDWQIITPCNHVRVNNERVQGVIKSHSDAIYYLRLPDGVI